MEHGWVTFTSMASNNALQKEFEREWVTVMSVIHLGNQGYFAHWDARVYSVVIDFVGNKVEFSRKVVFVKEQNKSFVLSNQLFSIVKALLDFLLVTSCGN